MKKPDYCAVVTFNADYVGRTWAIFDNWYNPHQARKSLFRSNSEPIKNWISSLYEVPVISATIWMIPLASRYGMKWQFIRTDNPYSTSLWHADACCKLASVKLFRIFSSIYHLIFSAGHPPPGGHLILSLLLAYCFVEEETNLLSLDSMRDDFINVKMNPNYVAIQDPVYLSPDEDDLYVHNLSDDAISIDFTDPKGKNKWQDLVKESTHWRWYADNADEVSSVL